MAALYWSRCPSPWGPLRLLATDPGLCAIVLPGTALPDVWVSTHLPGAWLVEGATLLRQAEAQLQAYFAGQRRDFDLPLDLHGTPFQQDVWRALRQIPYGETRSYAQVAAAVGRPGAARAVGAANAANPVPIIVPCHRVIRADGSIGGYGGGTTLKQALLRLEAKAG